MSEDANSTKGLKAQMVGALNQIAETSNITAETIYPEISVIEQPGNPAGDPPFDSTLFDPVQNYTGFIYPNTSYPEYKRKIKGERQVIWRYYIC